MTNPKKSKPPIPPKLSSKQVRHLRGLGHHLSPLVMLGKSGIDKDVLVSIEENLNAHELIKLKIQQTCPIDRHEAAQEISVRTGSAVAQILGKTILLFRRNRNKPKEKQLQLP